VIIDSPTAQHSAVTLIPHLLERTAKTCPEALATEDSGRTLTYRELLAEAEHLAGRLTAAGVHHQDRVGVMMRHSADLLVAILGVLCAGAAYVPIDADYPDQRKEFLAADACIKVLIVDSPEVGIPGLAAATFQPDQMQAELPLGGHQVDPNDLACVIYTSGSTGKPKGVMLTHFGLANLATAASTEFGIKPDDRYLMLAAAAFSASLEELFPPLVQGAASVFPADRAALSPVHALLRFLESHRVTLLEMQTAHWHLLVRHLADTGGSLPPSLRRIVVGGDRALPEAVNQWNRFGIPLVHVYGPTEATATATYWTVPAGQMPRDGILPIGEAITGTRIFVVDERFELVGPEDEGELLIGGDSLGRGYLDRPGATAEKFVADPFSGIPGARLYRTGDLVRQLPDGRLQFLRRNDRQIKVRGYRIEPSEIEAALGRHPAVRQVLVTTRQDGSGGRRLVAYVAADKDAVSAGGLRSFLAAELPSHLVPSALVRLDQLPMTVHRKIDVAALPAPKLLADLAAEFVPPSSGLERRLCATAAELLGLDEVGVLDDLLELGGDSLFMLRMISWIRSNLGVNVEFRDVFANYSVRGMAALATKARADLEARSG
jgi:amino acid adenylation domain-containing protein